MTCIAALVSNGEVFMASDSMHSDSYTEEYSKFPKVFKNNSSNIPFIIGYTTSTRMGQIIQYGFEPPRKYKDVTIEQYLFDFVNELKCVFEDHGFKRVDPEGEDAGGTFLLGIFGRLFKVQSDFSILELDHYGAVGSGADVAKGVLWHAHNYSEENDSVEIVTRAVLAATDHCSGVGGDINIATLRKEDELDTVR